MSIATTETLTERIPTMFAIFTTDNYGNRFQIDADEGASSVLGCGRPRIFPTRSEADAYAVHVRAGTWASVTVAPVLIVEMEAISKLEEKNRALTKILRDLHDAMGDLWPRGTREDVERALGIES